MKKGILTGIVAGVISISSVSAWSFTDLLNTWRDYGIFSYVLPFLLVFALVYGILTKANIFGDNKPVNAILALALGLLSLVGDFVPNFFQKIAPNLGIALSVLLAALVLMGLFMNEKKTDWLIFVIVGIAVIAFIAVVVSSFSDYPASIGNLWDRYGPGLATLLILGIIIGFVVWGAKKTGSSKASD